MGDKVLVIASDGQLRFNDVYAFGHKLAEKGVVILEAGGNGRLLWFLFSR